MQSAQPGFQIICDRYKIQSPRRFFKLPSSHFQPTQDNFVWPVEILSLPHPLKRVLSLPDWLQHLCKAELGEWIEKREDTQTAPTTPAKKKKLQEKQERQNKRYVRDVSSIRGLCLKVFGAATTTTSGREERDF